MKFNKFLWDPVHWLGEYGVTPLTHKKRGKAGYEALGQEILPIYSVLKEQGKSIPSYVENVISLIILGPL